MYLASMCYFACVNEITITVVGSGRQWKYNPANQFKAYKYYPERKWRLKLGVKRPLLHIFLITKWHLILSAEIVLKNMLKTKQM